MTEIAALIRRLSVGMYVIGGRVEDPSTAPILYAETEDMDASRALFG